MEQRSQWVVEESGSTPSKPKNKLPFVTPIKITDTMDDNQKTFFTNYNNMQKELIKNGFMDAK